MIFLAMSYTELDRNIRIVSSLFNQIKGSKFNKRLFVSASSKECIELMERLISWNFCIPTTFSLNSGKGESSLFKEDLIRHLLRDYNSAVLTTEDSLADPDNLAMVLELTKYNCQVYHVNQDDLSGVLSHIDRTKQLGGV